jgi:hypothetical protein
LVLSGTTKETASPPKSRGRIVSESVVTPIQLVGPFGRRRTRCQASWLRACYRRSRRSNRVWQVYSKIRCARLPSHDSAVRPYQIPVNPPAKMIAGVVVDIFSTDPCKALALQRNDPSAIGQECHNLALLTVQRCHGNSLLPRQNGIQSRVSDATDRSRH